MWTSVGQFRTSMSATLDSAGVLMTAVFQTCWQRP